MLCNLVFHHSLTFCLIGISILPYLPLTSFVVLSNLLSIFPGVPPIFLQSSYLASLSHSPSLVTSYSPLPPPSWVNFLNPPNADRVLCGPVSSSVFIEECCNCIFVVACQQLRVHSSSSSSFYVHVTSRAIIEDCRQVTFAPYKWSYPNIDAHYEVKHSNTYVYMIL